MVNLLLVIRPIVLIFSLLLSLGVFIYTFVTISSETAQIAHLVRAYALIALLYLYIALLISPLYTVFPMLPVRGLLIKARRPIGVSAFCFALLHASLAFFKQLGGFEGLTFLPTNYLIATSFGALSLFILFSMALTSTDRMVAWLTFTRWKFLHRFVYLVSITTVIHALMIGTHFRNLGNWISQSFFFAGIILLLLESIRFDLYLSKKFPSLSIGPTFATATTIIVGLFALLLFPNNTGIPSFGIHSQHAQIAKEIQQGTVPGLNLKIPGLQGDRTRRYTVSFLHDEQVFSGQDVPLRFQVFDAASGKEATAFTKISEKFAHLIIVDDSLSYFTHIHPVQNGNEFYTSTAFPRDGNYHVYLDFQPFGAIEQQIGFSLQVGNVQEKVVNNYSESFVSKGDYEVALKKDFFSSASMSIGEQILSFSIKDREQKEVKTLKPYLGSFGHLVMINQETYDYIHVHPTVPAKSTEDTGGPSVEFLPLGLYSPIKPGTYRVFAQFNPDDKLILSDFTIKVE
jgi:DMSO/TMAO reductase YedYZ heme-binding membrane subunit